MRKSVVVSFVAWVSLTLMLGSCMFFAPKGIAVAVTPRSVTIVPVEGLAAVMAELDGGGFDTDPFFSPRAVMERFPSEGQTFRATVTCLLRNEDGTRIDAEVRVSITVFPFDDGVGVLRDGDEWSYDLDRRCTDEEPSFQFDGRILIAEVERAPQVRVTAQYLDHDALLAAQFPELSPLASSPLVDSATLDLQMPTRRYMPPAY